VSRDLAVSAVPLPSPAAVPRSSLVPLALVYVLWGSTYLAIRVCVREGAGFLPFGLGAMRFLAAGGLLLAWAAVRGCRVRVSKKQLGTLAVAGGFFWCTGHGLLLWAEQHADSGYAALLFGSLPIWAALLECVLDRRMCSPLFLGSLLLGFAGVGLLSASALQSGTLAELLPMVALLAAAILWAAGSVLQGRMPVPVDAAVSSGYQLLIGGVGFVVAMAVFQEPLPKPTSEAWWAFGYLVFFGSILGFTAFVKARSLLPTGVFMTYAYVNPVVAVLLGWSILREPITVQTMAGTVLILTSVAGVFHDRACQQRRGR
jgi:drug/metabolite transporter (DMT)-like permease